MTQENSMAREISNADYVIDSREITERITELQNETVLTHDERNELASLTALAAGGSDYSPDWEYGSTLIRDSYFTAYAQNDYTSIDFDGITYWVR